MPDRFEMAFSASSADFRSTKAYPTGRLVRGLTGIEVDSLWQGVSGEGQSDMEVKGMTHTS